MTDEAGLYERIESISSRTIVSFDLTVPERELRKVCADFDRRLASQIAANEALRAQLQEKWLRINELERNNKLMAEQLIGNSQQPYPLLHS